MKFAGARRETNRVGVAVREPADGKVTVNFDEGFTQVEVKLNMTNISDVTAAHLPLQPPPARTARSRSV